MVGEVEYAALVQEEPEEIKFLSTSKLRCIESLSVES